MPSSSSSSLSSPDYDGDDRRSGSSSGSRQSSPFHFQSPILSPSGSCTSLDFERDSQDSEQDEDNEESHSALGLSPEPSVYSLTDSLKEQSIRFEYGRDVNTHSEIYKLAAVEREASRLGNVHSFYPFLSLSTIFSIL